MRIIAILSGLVVLALAAFLTVRYGAFHRPHPRASHATKPRWQRPRDAPEPQAPRPLARTNHPTEPADGFFLGKGDERVYVKYATPDPVLQSFLQSVMDGSTDPQVKGRQLFMTICAACHQRDGEGKDGVAPPLVGSEWALAPGGGRLVRIVLNGMSGPVRVGGRDWNLPMPPWRENLTDDQVAVVLTFIRSQLGTNHAGAISSALVAAARKEGHAAPETADTLLRIADP
jgi:mono/diheme cytochrome c family protein